MRDHEPHIDDTGFGDRVLAKLPPTRVASALRADWIIIAGAATGSAIVAAQFPFQPFLQLLVESAEVAAILACMAVALCWDSLQSG